MQTKHEKTNFVNTATPEEVIRRLAKSDRQVKNLFRAVNLQWQLSFVIKHNLTLFSTKCSIRIV